MTAAAVPWIRPDEVELDLRMANRSAVIGELARLLSNRLGCRQEDVAQALWARESLGSTALGHGVALPHARLPNVQSPVGAFVRLQQAVAFDAPDDKPVVFVLGLLLPKNDPSRQLNILAAIAAGFSEAPYRQSLSEAPDAQRASQLLTASVSP